MCNGLRVASPDLTGHLYPRRNRRLFVAALRLQRRIEPAADHPPGADLFFSADSNQLKGVTEAEVQKGVCTAGRGRHLPEALSPFFVLPKSDLFGKPPRTSFF